MAALACSFLRTVTASSYLVLEIIADNNNATSHTHKVSCLAALANRLIGQIRGKDTPAVLVMTRAIWQSDEETGCSEELGVTAATFCLISRMRRATAFLTSHQTEVGGVGGGGRAEGKPQSVNDLNQR